MSQETIQRNDDGNHHVQEGIDFAEVYANAEYALRPLNVSKGLRLIENYANTPPRTTAAVNAGFLTVRRTVPPVY